MGPLTVALRDNLSWRWAFYVNLPLAALAMFIISTKLKVHASGSHALTTSARSSPLLARRADRASAQHRRLDVARVLGWPPRRWSRATRHRREQRGTGASAGVLRAVRRRAQPHERYRVAQASTSSRVRAAGRRQERDELGFLLVPFMFTCAATLLAGRGQAR
jgi:MFS family permease